MTDKTLTNDSMGDPLSHCFFGKLSNGLTQTELHDFGYPTSKVVCVGRNYAEHAAELNNPVPKQPILFIKPSSCLVNLDLPIVIPQSQGECHHELEIALLVNQTITKNSAFSVDLFAGIGLALDLTLRDLQNQLKSKGQPWERAKSFDGACPVSHFVPIGEFPQLDNIDFAMLNNQKVAQAGNTKDMIFDIAALIQSITACFTLYPGDIVLTGTPKGVAALSKGDQLAFSLQQQAFVTTEIL